MSATRLPGMKPWRRQSQTVGWRTPAASASFTTPPAARISASMSMPASVGHSDAACQVENVGGSDPFRDAVAHAPRMVKPTEIGARLRRLRMQRRLKQVDAAEAIGISRSYLSGIETGGDVPGRATLLAFARYYETSLDYLESGRPPLPGNPLTGELVEDPDELSLLRFWRALTPEQREVAARLLNLERRRDAG